MFVQNIKYSQRSYFDKVDKVALENSVTKLHLRTVY